MRVKVKTLTYYVYFNSLRTLISGMRLIWSDAHVSGVSRVTDQCPGTEEVTSELALFGLSQSHHSNDPNIPKNLNL